MRLHQDNYAQVRCGKHGDLTACFPIQREVRQGCVLAPTLFCIFINGLIAHLNNIKDSDAPKMANGKVPALMFSDNTLLLAKSPMGIQRILNGFVDFCEQRGLEINLAKTKYMVFNPSRSSRNNPTLNNTTLERGKIFNYLGVTLTEHFSWGPQLDKVSLRLTQTTGGILKVFNNSFSR